MKRTQAAQAMKLFNPDRGWQRVDPPAASK
jgi:hypothetical protein